MNLTRHHLGNSRTLQTIQECSWVSAGVRNMADEPLYLSLSSIPCRYWLRVNTIHLAGLYLGGHPYYIQHNWEAV